MSSDVPGTVNTGLPAAVNGAEPDALVVRSARSADHEVIATLTVEAYVGGGFTPATGDYVALLRDVAARAAAADVPVAEHGGVVVGSVALAADGGPYAENAGPEDAVFRMLAVSPAARGLGAGERLIRACLERALAAGRNRMVISTQPTMAAAHRLYQRLGFQRNVAGDWSPRPGIELWSYTRALADLPAWCPRCGRDERSGEHAGCRAGLALEPPRYCRACGRRLVVQVTPLGWQASCSRHGARRSPDRSGH